MGANGIHDFEDTLRRIRAEAEGEFVGTEFWMEVPFAGK
jgi:hypothetical protein